MFELYSMHFPVISECVLHVSDQSHVMNFDVLRIFACLFSDAILGSDQIMLDIILLMYLLGNKILETLP